MPPPTCPPRGWFRAGVAPAVSNPDRPGSPRAPRLYEYPSGESYHMLDLSLEVLRVVENAAIASARTMGMGDAHTSDQAAVEAMRRCMDTIPIDGTIVIGEGERDSAPMLYIGEKVGAANNSSQPLSVDIAVDPL